ncbi:polysaccharide biosynthesis tyrosine autokinase [Arthrobacter sp. 2YAF22_2]|uniref:polysaccharide biosynthesis tyrosine autokinase n=1 Tax=Arthrobacter sp. 2YAF22_2 TaxID=3233029 RepID=UPI003F919F77
MDFSEYLGALKRSWALLCVLTLLGGAVGFGYARSTPPMYKASSSVFVSAQRGETTSELVQGSTYTQNLMQSYAQLAKLPSVLEPVILRLRLNTTAEKLGESVSAVSPLNTVLIDISVTDPSPAQAALIANAVTSSLATTVQGISPRTAVGTPAVAMQQVAEAQAPVHPFAPNTQLSTLTGALVGLVLAVIYALGRELLDTRIKALKDLRRVTDVPLLGTIPGARRRTPNDIVMRVTPHGRSAESYRRLAANLEYINPDAAVQSVVVTSASEGEGKSLTAVNLSLALSEKFDRVLLVDADLRQPRIAHYCQIEGQVGLSNVLAGAAELRDVIEPWGTIDVLPSGAIPPNPNQLINSEAMAALVRACAVDYDIVVLDSAPLLPVTDSLALSRITDGAVFVARAAATRRGQLASALDAIDGVNGHVLGIILNGVKESRNERSYGYGNDGRRALSKAAAQAPGDVPKTKTVSVTKEHNDPAHVRTGS